MRSWSIHLVILMLTTSPSSCVLRWMSGCFYLMLNIAKCRVKLSNWWSQLLVMDIWILVFNRSIAYKHKTCRFHDLFDHKWVTSVFVCAKSLFRELTVICLFTWTSVIVISSGFQFVSIVTVAYFFSLSIRNGCFWSHFCTRKKK